jgi:hypothetical protein
VAFAWRSDGEACGENTEAVFWNEIGTHIVMRDCLLVYGRFVETICQSCVVSSLEKTRLAKLYAALLNAKMRACIDLLTGRPEPDGATELAIEEASLVVRAIAELLLVAHRCGNNISLPAIRGAVFAGIDDPLLSQEFYPMVDRAARIAAADAGISVAWMSVDYLPS